MAQYRAQVEAAEIVAIVEEQDFVGEVAAKTQRYRFGPARTAPFGFVLVVAARTMPAERVFAFSDVAASGMAQSEEDPARRLHVRLREMAMKKERISQLDLAILTARAWNAWLTDRTGVAVRINEMDRTSAGFPRIIGGRDPKPASAG